MEPTTSPTDPGPGAEQPPAPRVRRSTTDRHLGGVAGGIAAYFGVDPVLVRIAFVVAAFAGGTGVIAYLIAWAAIPEDDGTVPTVASGPLPDGARLVGIGALVLAALIAVDDRWWGDGLLLPLVLIGGGAWILLRERDGEGGPAPDAGAAGHAGPAGPARPWVPPVPPLPPRPPRPPRSRTTVVTAGLVALLAGGLGLAAAAGADVTLEAGLVACLGVVAAGLLVGAFTGGARGLLGLAAPLLVALAAASTFDVPLRGGIGERSFAPTEVGDLREVYRLGVGELTLDLRDLDPDELPDRLEVDASVVMGELTVLLPDDLAVEVDARGGAGELDLLGRRSSGTNLDATERRDRDGPTLVLEVRVGLGTATVR